jgi:predicted dehydrogenase
VAVIDPDERAKTVAEGICEDIFQIKTYRYLREFLNNPPKNISFPPKDPIIVYDASPPKFHLDHLNNAQQHGLFYLGEKPLILYREQLDRLRPDDPNTPWFCIDFIETESLVFHTVRQFLQDNPDFKIQRLRFWRCGSTGFKKIFEETRKGVTGGSLEDKSPHDFSLSFGLLRERLKEDDPFTPDEAHIPLFMPANLHTLFANVPCFLTVTDSFTLDLTLTDSNRDPHPLEDPPADAAFTLKGRLNLKDGNSIQCEYYFSWVGLPAEFKAFGLEEELSGLFSSTEWSSREKWIGVKNEKLEGAQYTIEESRVGIIEGQRQGKPLILVCNFLSKYGLEPRVLKIEGGRVEPLELPDLDFGNNSLARVFMRVVDYVLEGGEAPYLDNKMAYYVHKAIKDAYQKAFEGKSYEVEDSFRVTKQIFRRALRPISV